MQPGRMVPGQARMMPQYQQSPAQQASQQQDASASMGQMQHVGDGSQDHRAAKRLKPTTKTLPRFDFDVNRSQRLGQSIDTLRQMSDSYARLQQIERKVDWNISRLRVEAGEKTVPTGSKRKMRLHVHTRAVDQPWQLGEGEEANEPDFDKGTNIPKLQVIVTAELLPRSTAASGEPEKRKFAQLVKQVTVESDHVPEPGERSGPFEWRRGTGKDDVEGLTVNIASTSALTFKLAVLPNHEPDLYSVPHELASLIDMSIGERTEILRALWTYCRRNGLVEQGGIRINERMKRIFHNQAVVAFHHVPEYLNRYLAPPAAMLIECHARADTAEEHFAWDMVINTRDPARVGFDTLYNKLDVPVDQLRALDEEISAACTRAQSLSSNIKTFAAFTTNPVAFVERYCASQAADLGKALGDHELGHKEGWQPRTAEEWQDVVRQAGI